MHHLDAEEGYERNRMLVLTRKVNETVIIGDDIQITIAQILPDRVRVGIHAPENVAFHRKEVAEKIASQLDDDEHTT